MGHSGISSSRDNKRLYLLRYVHQPLLSLRCMDQRTNAPANIPHGLKSERILERFYNWESWYSVISTQNSYFYVI